LKDSNEIEKVKNQEEDLASDKTQEEPGVPSAATANGTEPAISEKESHPSHEVRKLKEEIETEKRKNDDLVRQMKYLQADIVNLQRQSDRMLVDVRNQARFSLILELISVKEDLERAMNALNHPTNKREEELLEGLKLLDLRIENSLKGEEVSGIPVEVGSTLDPRLHEAISTRISDESEDGTILSVIGRGYTINGKVVKPALVEVAKKNKKATTTSDQARQESSPMGMDVPNSDSEKIKKGEESSSE